MSVRFHERYFVSKLTFLKEKRKENFYQYRIAKKFSLKPSLQRPYIKAQFFPVGKSRCSRINAFICFVTRKTYYSTSLARELRYFQAILFKEILSIDTWLPGI